MSSLVMTKTKINLRQGEIQRHGVGGDVGDLCAPRAGLNLAAALRSEQNARLAPLVCGAETREFAGAAGGSLRMPLCDRLVEEANELASDGFWLGHGEEVARVEKDRFRVRNEAGGAGREGL